MRSLTCVVLLFTVFSLVAVSAAQQASPTAAPKLIDDSDQLPLPAGMTTEVVAENATAKLLRCAAEGAGSGIEDRRPDANTIDWFYQPGHCEVNRYTKRLTGNCIAHWRQPPFDFCSKQTDLQQCPQGSLPKYLRSAYCTNIPTAYVDFDRGCILH